MKKRKEINLVTSLENGGYEGTFLKIEKFNGPIMGIDYRYVLVPGTNHT